MDNKYMDLISGDEKRYIKDYEDNISGKVANSEAIFKGNVVPYSYKPMFFSEEDVDNFRLIGETMLEIGDKIVLEYIRNEEFRKKFDFPKELEELILIENGYDINVPISRLDIFYKDGDNFKFCELNTDGSSAMYEDNIFAQITMETQAVKDLEEEYQFKYFELIDSWVKKSLEIYDSWEGKKVEKPNIAILDLIESATTFEFKRFKKAYEERGYKVKIVDPRKLEYRDGNLYDGDLRIDMVYRRLVTSEMIPELDKVQDFLQAYRDGNICVIGSFRSQIIHNKIIFKVLYDEDTKKLLSEEEVKFVNNHIPLTKEFVGGEEVFQHVVDNKDLYIMKPSDMNAGEGVYVGRDLTQNRWEEKLAESFNKDYIYQEFIEANYRDFILFKDGIEKVEFNSVVGIFMYGEEFAGLYTRIGAENVISSYNSHRAANLIFKKKTD